MFLETLSKFEIQTIKKNSELRFSIFFLIKSSTTFKKPFIKFLSVMSPLKNWNQHFIKKII